MGVAFVLVALGFVGVVPAVFVGDGLGCALAVVFGWLDVGCGFVGVGEVGAGVDELGAGDVVPDGAGPVGSPVGSAWAREAPAVSTTAAAIARAVSRVPGTAYRRSEGGAVTPKDRRNRRLLEPRRLPLGYR